LAEDELLLGLICKANNKEIKKSGK